MTRPGRKDQFLVKLPRIPKGLCHSSPEVATLRRLASPLVNAPVNSPMAMRAALTCLATAISTRRPNWRLR